MIDVFLVKYSFYSIKHNIFPHKNFDKLKNAIKNFFNYINTFLILSNLTTKQCNFSNFIL
jgi:hypothetical protein